VHPADRHKDPVAHAASGRIRVVQQQLHGENPLMTMDSAIHVDERGQEDEDEPGPVLNLGEGEDQHSYRTKFLRFFGEANTAEPQVSLP
jgi:hypothetical protein